MLKKASIETIPLEAQAEEIIKKCRSLAPPQCEAACPVHLDVKGYVKLIAVGKWAASLALIREKLPFPGILGRICHHPCESKCQRNEVDQSVSIRALERFATDWEQTPKWDLTIDAEKKEKIAIVGSGPAGLMAAYDLRKKGYQVTIFEAHSQLGGMLRWGIPEYRLPRIVLNKELGLIEKLGVTVKLNTRLGESISLERLRKDHDAVFLAIGAQKSARLGLDGEDLSGVYHGIDFLRKYNLGDSVDLGSRVVVIGGDNVAVDAARTCLRLGAKKVIIASLDCREEMNASPSEIEDARKEGIEIYNSFGPQQILKNGSTIRGVTFMRSKQFVDSEDRFIPTVDESEKTTLEADTIIVAIERVPDTARLVNRSHIETNQQGFFKVDPVTLRTNLEKVFAGGEGVTGLKSVVAALAGGRKAANAIDAFLKREDHYEKRDQGTFYANPFFMEIPSETPKQQRTPMPELPVKERTGNFKELELGLSEDNAKEEAARCLSCECVACKKNCEFLSLYDLNPREFAEIFKEDYRIDLTVPFSCNLCNLCAEMCPEGLDTGKLCHEIRKQAVAEGLAPFPQHKPVERHQKWAPSVVFKLTMADPQKKEETLRIFFPGCNLPSYSPDLVIKTYNYLRAKLPGTGIILNCCGSPSYLIGAMTRFQEIVDGIVKQIKSLGASEIITACSKCFNMLRDYGPSDLKIRSLYEVLVEVGLPETASHKIDQVFSVHDSCAARYEEGFTTGVRQVMKLLGTDVNEMAFNKEKTRCCGGGGLIEYVNPGLYEQVSNKRVHEALYDIVTYCAGCRENFAALKMPTLHILDLIFNPDWKKDRMNLPQSPNQRWKNMWVLKCLLKRL